jgi:hypothetical protein
MISAAGRKLRSELANAIRFGNPEDIADAKRRFRTRQLADALREGLAGDPPLTAEQLGELAGIIGAAARS